MKEINLNLSEEKEKKIAEQITKIIKRRKIKKIVINILLIVFTIVVTMAFSKLGTKLEAEFIFGQLCIGVVCCASYLYNYLISKSTYTEIESLLFNDEEIMQNITNEINKYEEKKD